MFRSILHMAAQPSGKAEVCKTFIHRFDSDRRLQNSNKLNSLRCQLEFPVSVWVTVVSQLGQDNAQLGKRVDQTCPKMRVKLSLATDQIVPDIFPKCKKPLFAHSACSPRSQLLSMTSFGIPIMAMRRRAIHRWAIRSIAFSSMLILANQKCC